MAEQSEYDRLLDHEYDGVREYDNPLPAWWTWLFVVSVAFSCLYVLYYHVGVGPSVHDRYQAEVARHVEKMLAELGELKADNATVVRFMNNPEWMSAMSGVFTGNCGQCHTSDGGGNIGPNLTDDHYKNVKEPVDIVRVISEGIAGTSMPAWKDRLREPQIILLAAYVASLRGTTPARAKAAEGSVIPPWPAVEPVAPEAPGSEAGGETGGDAGGGA